MQLIGEFKLGDEEKTMLWWAMGGWFACFALTILLNYRLSKDKAKVCFLELKNEYLKERLDNMKKN